MAYYVIGTLIVSTLVSATAARNQARAAQAVASNNARVAELQAEDALKRGDQKAMEAQRRARMVASAQRAAYSARGLDISGGTPGEVIDQTDFFGQSDAATARTNSRKEAWAARVAQGNYQTQASASDPSGAFGATLLANAPAVAGRWYSYSNPPKSGG